MLLAFDKSTGRVVWNSGTNSAYPDGPPDEVAYQATNVSVGLFRLNDRTDADTVARIFTNDASIKNGQVVIGGSAYTPVPPTDGGAEPEPPKGLDETLSGLQQQIDLLMNLVMLGGLQ
jgi:hypothetical protein